MSKSITAVLIFLGLAAGNFLWQFSSLDPNYATALERSYFQGIAVLALSFAWSC